ncbi:MAG: Nif3-like dinuclear metal center hexameric protein [Bacteroidetes bacterium]|nr:Nif3-like dinuclear metal center hexameric protein [Bacteroidota bacterium]MDA1120152.1 Nif3-like dinuclear metal center hexameric protein [Bacteroidota bacterium]
MKKKKSNPTIQRRRAFLTNVTTIAGTALVTAIPGVSLAGYWSIQSSLTVKQVIDIILKEIPDAPFERTVDQLRTGSMDQQVSGIVTTMFPTMEVIEKTAKSGANLIIAHETPFYNNQDETDWLQEDDAYNYKIDLLNKYGIAIWRFHDYWHRHKPDGIIMGNLIKLGWEKYYDAENQRIITLPETMGSQSIVDLVKAELDIPSVRLVGDLKQNCSTIYLAFGYMSSNMQIAAIQEYKPDLILSGETREWETVELVRDGQQMGQKTALMVLSHAVSEEAGMEYAAKWLQPKVPGVKVSHIASTNPFTFN